MHSVVRFTLLVVICGASAVHASEDWPNWRGPDATGIAKAPSFDPTLNQSAPAVLWRANVGNGYAAVSVAEGKAYTAGWKGGEETVYCFDAATGDPVWSKTYPAKKFDNMNAGGPGSTPAIASGKVVHASRDGKLRCFDRDDGRILWELDLPSTFNSKLGRWGFTGSPVIDGDTVVIDAGRIVRLSLDTGETVWRSESFGTAYSTPVLFELKGKSFVAAFPEAGLVVLDAKTGKTVAQRPWKTSYGVNAATPIVHGDLIFISSGYNTGASLFRLTGGGLPVVWEGRQMRNQMPTSLLIDGYLYGFDDKRLKCLSLDTGQEQWSQRGFGQGTLIGTDDGHLIVLTSKGELITAKTSPKGFQPIAKAKVIDEKKVWTMPTLADGRLYCRGSFGQLVCVDATGGK